MDKSELLEDYSDKACFVHFQRFFFLSFRLILDFLSLISWGKSDYLDDEFGNVGSDSRYSDTYYFFSFSLHSDHSVGSVCVFGSDVFAPTAAESKGDILAFNVVVPTGVKSKGGQLIELFWRSNSLFYFQI